MTYGSLFSGIGGIDLGLDRAGFECRWQVEIDPFARKVLSKHWPEVPKYEDVTKLTGRELERVDLIAGGFPCQDLSQAGKRAGIEGDRSGLWFEFARLIGILRPRYVLIENVPGLLDRRAMPRVIGELARLGYVGSWFCLRASDLGAAHLRKRVFVVAHCLRERPSSIEDRGTDFNALAHNSTCPPSGTVAHGETRGRGELREPSGFAGFTNRSYEELADSDNGGRKNGQGREAGAGVESNSDASINELADTERTRRDRRAGTGLRTDGRPHETARPSGGHEPMADAGSNDGLGSEQSLSRGLEGRAATDGRIPALENAGLAGDGRSAQPAGLDRRRSSDHDCCRTSGTLEHAARDEQQGFSLREAGEQLADSGAGQLPIEARFVFQRRRTI